MMMSSLEFSAGDAMVRSLHTESPELTNARSDTPYFLDRTYIENPASSGLRAPAR